MKTKSRFGMLMPFLCLLCLTSCNKNEPLFSAAQIQQALFDLKGTYHGTVGVSYYQGSRITEPTEAVAVSRDSLAFTMSLLPIADVITDENIAQILREAGEVKVTAGYDFSQMDYGHLTFVLRPKDAVIPGGYGTPPTVRIVFSQYYGGNATPGHKIITFNISPIELWLNDKKYEDFKQLVYHFEGEYE